jgi:succinate-semialdehyde dehydrogenase / glutarate-semialdehyde dehydrogenase
MATTSTTVPTGVILSDPTLFRQSCYVDGAWINAQSGATISVDNPATGEVVGTVPRLGAAETRAAIEAADREGTRCGRQEVVRADAAASG